MGANPEHICDEHEFSFPEGTDDYCVACGMRKVDFETITALEQELLETRHTVVQQVELRAKSEQRVEGLEKIIADERACEECWEGKSCGSDCYMLDVVALAEETTDKVKEALKETT